MTRRWSLLANIRSMAIDAVAGLLKLRQFLFNRRNPGIRRFLVVLVTGRADRDRHVWSQTSQRSRPSNIDVAGGALQHMLALAAFMTERCRLERRQIDTDKRGGRLMATGAVVAGRLLIFPVTVEAGVMRMRHRLEKSVWLQARIWRSRWRRNVRVVIRLMADRAVIVVRLPFLDCERSTNDIHQIVLGRSRTSGRDHVLMFVVRKLDHELSFIFRFYRLVSRVRFAKREAYLRARCSLHMTYRANSRTGSHERLSGEKLLSMTTDAGIVVREVSYIGKIAAGRPWRGNLVTRVASQAFVLVGGMLERGVPGHRCFRRLGRGFRGRSSSASLCRRARHADSKDEPEDKYQQTIHKNVSVISTACRKPAAVAQASRT
jgi:hypothetical protein